MRNKEFSDRRGDAATAKAAQMKAFLAAQIAAAPERAAKTAERVAVAQAREERQAVRLRLKREEELKAAAEAAELITARQKILVQEQADLAAKAAEVPSMDSHIARIISDGAARKAERDLRYSKRKAAARGAA